MAFQPGAFQINFQQVLVAPAGMSVILAPDYEPGDAPRLGHKPDRDGDLEFWALARVADAGNYLQDVDRWLAEVEAEGSEPVDVFASSLDDDGDLFGRKRRW